MKKAIFLSILAIAILVSGCVSVEKDLPSQEHAPVQQRCH
jgi:PBP1b-binding outer membrane lipoprotein LpoB